MCSIWRRAVGCIRVREASLICAVCLMLEESSPVFSSVPAPPTSPTPHLRTPHRTARSMAAGV